MVTTITKNKIYQPTVAVPPGETLLEILETKGITQSELAKRMGRPLKLVNEIIKGKTTITSETAMQLEQVLGVPARLWNNLEAGYQDTKARLSMVKSLLDEASEAKQYPYAEMAKWKWVPATKDIKERIRNLLSFFGVTSLNNIIETQGLATAYYRISQKRHYSTPAIAVWLRKGTIDAQSIETDEFDNSKLLNSIGEIRSLTLESPEVFHPKLVKILSDCGVAFVVVPNLKNAPINGATRWINPKKALLQMSIRNKYADIFWFSLFHELGHIIHHSKKTINIDFAENRTGLPKEESEADLFASNSLIPSKNYEEFTTTGNFSIVAIKEFAKKLGIDSDIVIGRLQHDGLLPYKLNIHKSRFEWVKES